MKRFWLAILILFIAQQAHAAYVCPLPTGGTVRYVSPTGSGSACTNSATGGTPCTFQTALNAATNGSHIVAKSGTYRVTVFTVNSGVDICSETRLGAVLQPPVGWNPGDEPSGNQGAGPYIEIRDTNIRMAGFNMDGNNNGSNNVLGFSQYEASANSIVEYSWIQDSEAALVAQMGNRVIFRHNLLEDAATEAMYIGSSNPTGKPFIEDVQIIGNKFYRTGSGGRHINSIDLKQNVRRFVIDSNIFEEQVGGSDGCIQTNGYDHIWENNIWRNTPCGTAVLDSVGAWAGLDINGNVAHNVPTSSEFIWWETTFSQGAGHGVTQVRNNTICSASSAMCQRNTSNCSLPSGITQSGNDFGAAQSVCNAEVARIMGEPVLVLAEIGGAGGTSLLATWSTLISGAAGTTISPLSVVANSNFAVTYAGAPQSEVSTVIVSPTQTRTTMAAAPLAGQAVSLAVTPGAVFNSVDIGGTIKGTNAAQTIGVANALSGIPMSQLQAAINSATPGTTITVADGTYNNPGIILIDHNRNCTQANPCTIRALSGGGVVITGNTSGMRIRGNDWRIEGFTVSGQTGHPGLDGWLELYSARRVVIDDFTFTGQSGDWDHHFVLGNPSNTETGQDVTIQNSEFANGTGLDQWVFDWNIRESNHNHTGFQFLDNHVHDLHFDAGTEFGGNKIGNSHDRAVFNCNGLFQGNTWERITGSETQASGLFHPKCSGLVWRDEIFRDSDRNSIRLRAGDGNVIDRSTFENNNHTSQGGDVSIAAGRDHRITNNVFNAKNGAQRAIGINRGCHLASNRPDPCNSTTCHYEATTGTILANNTYVGYSDHAIALGITPSPSNCAITTCPSVNDIVNSIFFHDSGGHAIEVQSSCSNANVDDNIFFLQGGADLDRVGTGALFQDPQFTSLISGNFTLRASSPAIDAGHNVANTTLDDFDRAGGARPQDLTWDLGAYEFGAVVDPPPPPPTTSLIAHWTFDSTLSDAQGNANLSYGGGGSPAYVAGLSGLAIELGGANFATVGAHSIVGTELMPISGNPFSVSAFFKTTTTGTVIASATAEATSKDFQVFLENGTLDTILRGVRTVSPATYNDGEWHHVAVTWNGTAAQYYIDGMFVSSMTVGSSPEDTGEHIIIGARTGGTGFFFNGTIDEVKVFNAALSPAEVAALASLLPAAPADITSGLIAHWTLDDTLANSAPGGGVALVHSGTPAYETGQIGNAITLDGTAGLTTGVHQIGTTRLFPGAGNPFTVSSWFKYGDASGTLVASAVSVTAERDFQIALNNTGRVDWYLRGTQTSLSEGFNDAQWHHTVVTWDGVTAQIYVDGLLRFPNAAVGVSLEDTGEAITVGTRTGDTAFRLDGAIDDVRIYSRALPQAAVTALFDLQPGPADLIPPSPPGAVEVTEQLTVAWAPSMDDSGGTIFYRIEICDGAACEDFEEVGTTTATEFNLLELAPNTLYLVRVIAEDPSGNLSDPSAVTEVTVVSSPSGARREGGSTNGGFFQ